MNDPRRGCTAHNPFVEMTGGGRDYGCQYNVPRTEQPDRKGQKRFSLAESGRAVEAVKSSVGSVYEGGSRHGYSVDPSMFPDDEVAGVLRNGEYVKNPTAHNINDYISEGSNYLGSKKMNGQYMYVVDMDGNIVIGTRGGQRMPHPTLVGGSNPQVQAAGMLEIRGGKIYSINNASGHFKPSNECLGIAEKAFGSLPQNIISKDFQGYLSYGQ